MSDYDAWGKFAKHEGHITHDMLNEGYGESGKFYKSKKDAESYQKKAGGVIYPIWNYFTSQVHCERMDEKTKAFRIVLDEGAKKHIEGYYVSHPPELETQETVKYNKK